MQTVRTTRIQSLIQCSIPILYCSQQIQTKHQNNTIPTENQNRTIQIVHLIRHIQPSLSPFARSAVIWLVRKKNRRLTVFHTSNSIHQMCGGHIHLPLSHPCHKCILVITYAANRSYSSFRARRARSFARAISRVFLCNPAVAKPFRTP